MKTYIIIIVLFFHISISAQDSFGRDVNQYDLCLNGYINHTSTINATYYVNKILESIGIPNANFVLVPCRYTDNACAIIYNNRRYILYDDLFLNQLSQPNNNSYYSNLFILAHEIAHHLNGHTLSPMNNDIKISQKEELDSDEFAGFIVAKMKGNKEDITNVLKSFPHPTHEYSTHPTYEKRLRAALRGFQHYNSEIRQEKEKIEQYYQQYIQDYQQKIKEDYTKQITSQYENYQYSKSISKAHIELFNYELNNKREHLENAIKYFQQASAIKDDLTIMTGLANTYWLLGYLESAQIYFKQAYEVSNDPTYLLLYWDLYSQQHNTQSINNLLDKTFETIDYSQIHDYTALIALSRFYSLKGIQNGIINTEYISKSINILNYIENDSIYIIARWDHLSQMNLAGIYSDLTVNYNAIEDYKSSYFYIVKAIELYKIVKQNNLLDCIGKKNLYRTIRNKALIEMRLKKWKDVLSTTNILLVENEENSDVYYYRGRAYAGLGDHQNATKEYTLALKLAPSDSYIYYYRGISYCKFKETFNLGILDLHTACSGNYNKACETLKNILK